VGDLHRDAAGRLTWLTSGKWFVFAVFEALMQLMLWP
jgi:hypothetical protein